MVKAAVILGAGASFDISNDSWSEDPTWRPPLTKDLFGDRAKRHFAAHLTSYPGARLLHDDLYPEAVHGSLQLETKLRELFEHDEEVIRQHFKHVPAYLRDVLNMVGASYQSRGNYTRMLIRLLETGHQVAFIVLNYDNLLERTLKMYDESLYSFESLDHYVADGRPVKVFKLHGSVDWGYRLQSKARRWHIAVGESELGSLSNVELLPRPHNDINAGMFDISWWYPALTAPLAGKRQFVCPPEHTNALAAFLQDCRKYMVIGSSGNDADLLDLLSKHAGAAEIVGYVSDNDVSDVRHRFENAVPRFNGLMIAPRDWNQGFKDYMMSDGFEWFVYSTN